MIKSLFILFVNFSLASVSFAGDVEEMRSVLEANFDACNREDSEDLLRTCSVDMPDREGFKKESIELWKEKDIYYRLVKFKVLKIEKNYAEASVVQFSQTKDRSSDSKKDEFRRNGTTLLTKKEQVEYKVAFKKDRGVWKCYLTLTEPVEYKVD